MHFLRRRVPRPVLSRSRARRQGSSPLRKGVLRPPQWTRDGTEDAAASAGLGPCWSVRPWTYCFAVRRNRAPTLSRTPRMLRVCGESVGPPPDPS